MIGLVIGAGWLTIGLVLGTVIATRLGDERLEEQRAYSDALRRAHVRAGREVARARAELQLYRDDHDDPYRLPAVRRTG